MRSALRLLSLAYCSSILTSGPPDPTSCGRTVHSTRRLRAGLSTGSLLATSRLRTSPFAVPKSARLFVRHPDAAGSPLPPSVLWDEILPGITELDTDGRQLPEPGWCVGHPTPDATSNSSYYRHQARTELRWASMEVEYAYNL